MIRKLVEGFIFGVGFSLALGLVVMFVLPRLMPHSVLSNAPSYSVIEGASTFSVPMPEDMRFHELPLEEQISKASAIALARYEPSPDGKMRAIIREFLKKDPEAVIYYKIGDEYASGSFYPNQGIGHGDGMIIFFVGSPATMRLAMTYSGDRIGGLADIPVELFRKKCEAPDA